MDLGLKGRRALVMGASKGLGRAIAEALAAEGAAVAVASRDAVALAALAERLSASSGARAVAIAADVSDPASLDAMADRAVAELGGVDILVLNHGGPPAGMTATIDLAQLEIQFHRMVMAPIRVAQRLLPAMRERKWGRIITIGSSGMVQPLPNLALSNVLRGAIVGWNKSLANEVAGDGVTCNIIAPGAIATDRLTENLSVNAAKRGATVDQEMAARAATIPAGRIGRPDEFGAMAAFIASDKASYVTGSLLLVDGGAVKGI